MSLLAVKTGAWLEAVKKIAQSVFAPTVPVPTDESGRAAYDDGFEKAEDAAVNPFRQGSRLHACWKQGQKDGRANLMQQW